MADAVISIVAERVAAIVEEQIRYQVNLVRGVEKEVLRLCEKLETIRDVLDDAEKRGVKEQSVKKWLKKLEDSAYEMDDVVDEWYYALLKHKMEHPAKEKVCCSFIQSSSSCLCFKKVVLRRDIAVKIRNVKAKLDRILKEKDDFSFLVSLPPTDYDVPKSWRDQSTSSIKLDEVRGKDIHKNKKDIVRKLRFDSDSQIVCVVGMGGLGKTTLAQLVYNDEQIKDCFELRIWICVSDPFNMGEIARGIVESVTRESIPPTTIQLEVVLEKLRDCITKKKFLLVLDDVWTEDYSKWEPLKNILSYGEEGSKIMVTTRKEGVAKMIRTMDKDIYRPQQLSDEECWSLLSHIALFKEECREFEDVGKKIAKKCKGLPLAAKVLGSLLQCKRSLEEWENVLESEIWRLEEAQVDLFPHLLLSYNELSPSLKRCFSYCAVYPKDFVINVESLIKEWMALGYLGPVREDGGVEVKGRDYFNNLAMRSLFQEFKRKGDDPGEEIEWCKIHDIVHDFALFLRESNSRVEVEGSDESCQFCNALLVYRAKEYRSFVWDKRTHPHVCDCLVSIRVLRFKWIHSDIPQGMEKLVHLRWLEFSNTELSNQGFKIICSLYFLQTLLLPWCSLEEIPDEIRNLVHLRHLDLSNNRRLKELPESIFSLLELQILNIERCQVMRLPEGIHGLRNLKHLLLENIHSSKGYRLPQGLARLSGLRTLRLSPFYVGRGWNKLALLKSLNRLTGALTLRIPLSSIDDLKELAEDAREAELRKKIHIRTLRIEFEGELVDENERPSSSSSVSSLWMSIIEALEPNRKLQRLTIREYGGYRLPQWISSPLNYTKEIYLSCLSELTALPPMGKLPFLELLSMEGMRELEFVGREFLGLESSSSLPSSSSSSSSSTSSNDEVVAFPKLKELMFTDFAKWSEWEDITAEEEESEAFSVMPCLVLLRVNSCGSLKKLPHRLLRKASSLKLLDVGEDLWELLRKSCLEVEDGYHLP